MKVPFLPYDKKLVPRARELRREATKAEEIFWDMIKHKKLNGLKFTRQKPLGPFILDFYCAKLKLGIEIDGEVHNFQKMRDKERDNFLEKKFKVKVIRYKNEEVINNKEIILKEIEQLSLP